MEEIDIIELLKRVKEGKAPKEIEIEGSVYEFRGTNYKINELYGNGTFLWFIKDITLNTKIKILDKPIIEELEMVKSMDGKVSAYPNEEIVFEKINEIIKYINKEKK